MEVQKYSESWYETLSGRASLETIDDLCSEAMSEIFGYYALEIGVLSGQYDLLNNSRITAGFSLVSAEQNIESQSKNITRGNSGHSQGNLIISTSEQLPIETDNVDLVVASHILELSKDPHQVLREIDRVLVPEGHCILIGFNPFSLSRVGRFLKPGTYKRKNPYKMRAAHRVRDWFSLLGFEVIEVNYFGFRPHVNNGIFFERMGWLETLGNKAWPVLGNMYMLHVKKQVVAMRPHKKVWKAPAVLTGGKVALNNTARKIRHRNFSKL